MYSRAIGTPNDFVLYSGSTVCKYRKLLSQIKYLQRTRMGAGRFGVPEVEQTGGGDSYGQPVHDLHIVDQSVDVVAQQQVQQTQETLNVTVK